MFRRWNNIVWDTKHKCLTRETILFDEWNNIVWLHKYALWGLKRNNHASQIAWIFLKYPALVDFSKRRVSWKRWKYWFCQAEVLFLCHSVYYWCFVSLFWFKMFQLVISYWIYIYIINGWMIVIELSISWNKKLWLYMLKICFLCICTI